MGRLLVVDDDRYLLEGLERYLSRLGVVDAVAAAADALHLSSQHRYDVAVIDIHLGRDSGVDLIDRMLAARPDAVGAVVFHTGNVPMPEPPLGVEVPHAVVSKGDLIGLRQAVASYLER